MRFLLLASICGVVSAQSFEQPRQQLDVFAAASYRQDSGAASMVGTAFRQNIGRYAGLGGYYNFSREDSFFGTSAAGSRISGARDIHDYGAAVEIHAASRVQPYGVATIGWITQRVRGSAENFAANVTVINHESHFAYGGGAGLRYHLNEHVAVFVESRVMRPAISHGDYFIRASVGVSIGLPDTRH